MLKQVQHDDNANVRNAVVSGTAAFGDFVVESGHSLMLAKRNAGEPPNHNE
ncbi:hypothetical protein H0274_01735 [Altererythrobacter sp. CC-YST694]|uniref:hypothetical protein n=1 Tax=Altererythrobacter sp. CC-YST694 TaxID=2755038 RepID=UPI001D02750E|nr:hypothetical protein [Altererythrobacter sp. CC-YST694]MCB5423966.1 hypothetical protein [Altererythrobacter sp. CC-YST694]